MIPLLPELLSTRPDFQGTFQEGRRGGRKEAFITSPKVSQKFCKCSWDSTKVKLCGGCKKFCKCGCHRRQSQCSTGWTPSSLAMTSAVRELWMGMCLETAANMETTFSKNQYRFGKVRSRKNFQEKMFSHCGEITRLGESATRGKFHPVSSFSSLLPFFSFVLYFKFISVAMFDVT